MIWLYIYFTILISFYDSFIPNSKLLSVYHNYKTRIRSRYEGDEFDSQPKPVCS